MVDETNGKKQEKVQNIERAAFFFFHEHVRRSFEIKYRIKLTFYYNSSFIGYTYA